VSTFLGVWLLLGLSSSFFALGREELNLRFVAFPRPLILIHSKRKNHLTHLLLRQITEPTKESLQVHRNPARRRSLIPCRRVEGEMDCRLSLSSFLGELAILQGFGYGWQQLFEF